MFSLITSAKNRTKIVVMTVIGTGTVFLLLAPQFVAFAGRATGGF
jgi:hypothetical protein